MLCQSYPSRRLARGNKSSQNSSEVIQRLSASLTHADSKPQVELQISLLNENSADKPNNRSMYVNVVEPTLLQFAPSNSTKANRRRRDQHRRRHAKKRSRHKSKHPHRRLHQDHSNPEPVSSSRETNMAHYEHLCDSETNTIQLNTDTYEFNPPFYVETRCRHLFENGRRVIGHIQVSRAIVWTVGLSREMFMIFFISDFRLFSR